MEGASEWIRKLQVQVDEIGVSGKRMELRMMGGHRILLEDE